MTNTNISVPENEREYNWHEGFGKESWPDVTGPAKVESPQDSQQS